MSLISCTMCGKDISPNAVACPHCGEPMKENSNVDIFKKYRVVLKGNVYEKIKLIKAIMDLTGIGIKEAKDVVERIPSEITTCNTYDDAQKVCGILQQADTDVIVEIIGCDAISNTNTTNSTIDNIDRVVYSTPKPSTIKCPNCNSTKTSKITMTGRAIGIFAFGIGSSSMGKTWKCNGCGYKW